MLIGCIEGANCVMRGNGADVADLKVIRTQDCFVSAWIPTPEEVAAINAGAPVYLCIYGDKHPPVYVGVKQE